MAILSQILGSSYGRGPAAMNPVHMMGMNIPGMTPDMNANAYHSQPTQGDAQQGQQGQQGGGGMPGGQSVNDVINQFKARLQAMRNPGGQALGFGPEPAPVPVDPTAMPSMTGGLTGGAPGGIMNSIAGLGGGASGGLDPATLASLLPMLGL